MLHGIVYLFLVGSMFSTEIFLKLVSKRLSIGKTNKQKNNASQICQQMGIFDLEIDTC